MSIEAAVAFYELLETDAKVADRVRELATPDKIEPYVKKELGYEFTKQEMQKVVFERNPEMTDEELEAVTGGTIMIVLVFIVGYIAIAAA